jgi:hypothetical protein
MQVTSPPRWFTIVSSATGGLTGLAIADDELALTATDRDHRVDRLDPVWSGSFTGWRETMPGALSSMRRFSVLAIGPLPSIGRPSAFTTRPRKP